MRFRCCNKKDSAVDMIELRKRSRFYVSFKSSPLQRINTRQTEQRFNEVPQRKNRDDPNTA